MDVRFTDHSAEVRAEFEAACLRALEACGLQAESYAKKACPVDTGLLRNSITHAVSGQPAAITEYRANKGDKKGSYTGTAPEDSSGTMSVYVGTNVEYAAYVELGSGRHYSGGRDTPWSYKDAKGKSHKTSGNGAQPFLKPAVADHAQTYRTIIENELRGG